MECPRCKKNIYNTFIINRYNIRVPVNKCIRCGFLWIEDEVLVDLSRKELKKLFIEDLRKYGKEK